MAKVIGEAGDGKRLFKVTLDAHKGYVHACDETDAIRGLRDTLGLPYCAHQAAVAVDAVDPEDVEAAEPETLETNDELANKTLDDDAGEKLDELKNDAGKGDETLDKPAAQTEADAIRAELEKNPGITNADVVKNLKARDVIVKSSQVTEVRKAIAV